MILSKRNIVYSFYLINFVALILKCNDFYNSDLRVILTSTDFPFYWIPDHWDINTILPMVSILVMVSVVLTLPFVNFRLIRVFWFCLNFIIFGLDFNRSLGHSSHLIVLISMVLLFLKGDLAKKKSHSNLSQIILACQLQIFIVYGLAGIWKLVALFKSFSDPNIVVGSKYIAYSVAHEFLNSNTTSPISFFLGTQDFLSSLISILVILIQLGSLFVCFFPSFYFAWGIGLCLFQIGTLIVVNVFFIWPIPIMILFLCLAENKDNVETKKSDCLFSGK